MPKFPKTSEFIKKIRKSAKMNQLQFAELLNTDQNIVSALENGKQKISFRMLKKITDKYNLNLDDIMIELAE
jgi:transcriptional regulator with XRE-family HTH domain